MSDTYRIYVCLARFPPNPEIVPCATFSREAMEKSLNRVSDIIDVVMQGRVVSLGNDEHFRKVMRGG